MAKYLCYKCNREYESNEIRFTNTNKFACVYCLGVKQRDLKELTKKKS